MFFGPHIVHPDEADYEGIHPEHALGQMIFGDLGLIKGRMEDRRNAF